MCDRDEAMGVNETNTVEEDVQPTTTDQWMDAAQDEASPSGPLPTLGKFTQAPGVRPPFPPSYAHNN